MLSRMRENEHCHRCQKEICSDEIAMTKKLINRGTTEYYCFDCLANFFDITKQDVILMMEHHKAMGCTLFVSNRTDSSEKIYYKQGGEI